MCRHYLFEISSHLIDKVYLYVKEWYILGNFLFNPFSTKQEIVLNFENEIRNERFIFFLFKRYVFSWKPLLYILLYIFYVNFFIIQSPDWKHRFRFFYLNLLFLQSLFSLILFRMLQFWT